MSKIKIAVARLGFQEPCSKSFVPYHLRCAVASQFPDRSIFHQHGGEGLIYRYPMVQYRRDKGDGLIVSFGEGAESLIEVPFFNRSFRLGRERFCVSDVQLSFSTHIVSVSSCLNRYFFRSPWLPFNQTNYLRYRKMSLKDQRIERDRIAVNHILSALKGLGVFVKDRILASFEAKKFCRCLYKGVSFWGFQGALVTNVDLPSGIAIGRSVSGGYGWLERVDG